MVLSTLLNHSGFPGEQELTMPHGDPVVAISAVGFDPSRTRAIAYVASYLEGDGAGGYHLWKKNKYGWAEVDDSPACQWMSFHWKESPLARYT